MAKLTDKQQKMVVADRAEGASIRKLAKKYNVSTTTIQNALKKNTEVTQKVTHKKEQNTADILAHMDSQRDKVCLLIDVYLEALMDPEKIKKATPSQLSTALGTVIDKFTAGSNFDQSEIEDMRSIRKEVFGDD